MFKVTTILLTVTLLAQTQTMSVEKGKALPFIRHHVCIEKSIENENVDLLFVGDSRFVGMEQVNTNEYPFYCKVGKGYFWYCENSEEIESLITDSTKIVFGLGVNDLYNIGRYKELENSEYFDSMYFLSVNPVNETKEADFGYSVTNSDICDFNEEMKSLFGDRYIDSYSYLIDTGYSTRDGLHYSKDTYQDIYNFILEFFD